MNKLLLLLFSIISLSVNAQEKHAPIEKPRNQLQKIEVMSLVPDDSYEASFYKKSAKLFNTNNKEPLMYKYIVIKMNGNYYHCSGGGGPGLKCWNIDNVSNAVSK